MGLDYSTTYGQDAVNSQLPNNATRGEQDASTPSVGRENLPKSNAIQIPSVSLPKGGGALKNIDEKFEVNPANGTASFSLPLPFSKARNDFAPSLSLSYNSGGGNGVFGLGWSCDVPCIQRRTDKQLPEYRDANESDDFLFSGADDLVPVLVKDNMGNWQPDEYPGTNGETVKRYRPRIEGRFNRIERITPQSAGTFYWKVTTKGNIVTIFGRDPSAQISDPSNPSHIFRWLPELTYDDRGNCFEYKYVNEDLLNVPGTLHEQNRLNHLSAFTNGYLKRIRYGNNMPYPAPDVTHTYSPAAPGDTAQYMFETVFDFGEENIATSEPAQAWPVRYDPFSVYKAGFEIRTNRLCRRILFFHNFKELNDGKTAALCLVRSLNMGYKLFQNASASPSQIRNAEVDYVISIRQVGYIKNPDKSYTPNSLPPVEFSYQELQWNRVVQNVLPQSFENDPTGLSGGYQWTDLWSEGIPGILTEQTTGWYYKSNQGDGEFSPARPVIPKPSFTGLQNGALQLQDLEADGRKFIVSLQNPAKGYFQISDDDEWLPFHSFDQMPAVDFDDPNAKFIDLDGDGRPDLIVSEENAFVWYPNKGMRGYGSPIYSSKPYDEEKGPAMVFADSTQSIFISDMTGDGLADIVRIRNGEVCYWPNSGYGKFAAKVNMDFAPFFDTIDLFNPAYLRLADVSGTGATDILYLGQDQFRAWFNLSGNAWSEVQTIDPFPSTAQPNQISVVDFIGNGTGCIVWSSPLPQYSNSPMRYIDLMGGMKPYIMQGYRNNFGKEVSWQYKSSTEYYLEDKLAGKPWVTKLPFPVQCVAQSGANDLAAGTYFTSLYSYHHGYYDHAEKEFRGFGRVEQLDTEDFENFQLNVASNVVENDLHQPPVRTVSWFHTGAWFRQQKILDQFEQEYNKGPFEFDLPTPVLPAGLTADESREALRACKGMMLRQEIYAMDGTADETEPYSVTTRNRILKLLQPRLSNSYAVFLTQEGESLNIHYERNLNDPRIGHTLNIEVDDVGNVLKSASIAYGRKTIDASLPAEIQTEQNAVHVVFTQNDFTINPLDPTGGFYFDTPTVFRAKMLLETKTYELTKSAYNAVSQFEISDLLNDFETATTIDYDALPDGSLQKRLIGDVQTVYLNNDLNTAMLPGQMDTLAFVYQTYQLALTPTLVSHLLGTRIDETVLTAAQYVQPDGTNWWIPSGRNNYLQTGETATDATMRFYLPVSVIDALGIETKLFYDGYNLLLTTTTDALQNTFFVGAIDYRVLQPTVLTDPNNNSSEVLFDGLGMVIATSVYGDESDGMHGDKPLDIYSVIAPTGLAEVISDPQKFLQQATSFFYYDHFAWINNSQPVSFATVARETHVSELSGGSQSKVFLSVGYSSGLGKNLQTKIQAEPGDALQWENDVLQTVHNVNPRWVGNGRTILNNKGNPVKQYEPFFSTTYQYEDEEALVEIGFSPVLYYDPLSRLIKTEFADGTFSTVELDAWAQISYDQNDTVKDSTWYDQRILHPIPSIATPGQIDAANKAAAHYNTPSQAHLDSLGRIIYTIADNGTAGKYATRVVLDIENNQRQVIDARGNMVMNYDYNMVSRQIRQSSMDAGQRWFFSDVMNKPLYKWDSRDQRFRMDYDDLHRPTNQWLTQTFSQLNQAEMDNPVIKNTPQNPLEKLIGTVIYGENQTVNGNSDTVLNLRGKAFQTYDQSGLAQINEYDFKGNVKSAFKELAADYKNIISWFVPDKGSLLDNSEIFNSAARFDATNKATEMDLPDGSKVFPLYNLANLLEQVNVFIQGQNQTVSFVQNIGYNAKGQRENILYGNNTSTGYSYEPATYRLTRLLTTRSTGADTIQDLNYTYDPVGNITQIVDNAQQTIFFNNAAVDPSSQFQYDAIYRLISAQGREHAGQNLACDQFDKDKTQDGGGQRLVLPGDMNAMQLYQQQYQYDDVGNLIQMIHNAGNGGFSNRWTRIFTCNPNNNQLVKTQVGANAVNYSFDSHGNMLNLQQGSFNLTWNYADQLQQVDLGGGGIAYYVYDGGGQRVRKVIENGALVKDRIYLPSYEVYREKQGANIQLERETVHVMDDRSRIALIETRTRGQDNGLNFLIRYQYANHLGTACVELTGTLDSTDKNFAAGVISYEEYYPFGSTSYQAMDNQTETAKRYRYTGMERDQESGMNYHGARYYLPWLGRWVNPDPLGIEDDLNVYGYARSNPNSYRDLKGTDSKPPDSDPPVKTVPARPDKEVFDEILYGPPEYVPKLNISNRVLTEDDKIFEGKQGALFKKRIEEAAAAVDIDPGLLTAALLAEVARKEYTKTSGEQTTFVLGSDDLVEKEEEAKRRIPAARDINFTSFSTDFNEQGREVTTGHFDATKAVLVNAVYLKYGELKVRDELASKGTDFESLTPELRFAFTRLAMNPGNETVVSQVDKFLKTRDIADTAPTVLIRSGIKGQDASKPQSGATLVAARGIHLSQTIFGNVYTASKLTLAPPEKPLGNKQP